MSPGECWLSADIEVFEEVVFREIEALVVKPLQDLQSLFDSSAWLTRLYMTAVDRSLPRREPASLSDPDVRDAHGPLITVRSVSGHPIRRTSSRRRAERQPRFRLLPP